MGFSENSPALNTTRRFPPAFEDAVKERPVGISLTIVQVEFAAQLPLVSVPAIFPEITLKHELFNPIHFDPLL